MPIKIEVVTPKVELGEGPFWDADSQCLYFVDVFKKTINKYRPLTKTYTKAQVPTTKDGIATVIPIEGQKDQFLIGAASELIRVHWDGISDNVEIINTVADLQEEGAKCRWNDARVDFSGRLWSGFFPADLSTGVLVVPENGGGLYTIESNGALKKRWQGFSMPNGLDWNNTQDSFYIIDSLAHELLKFDYNPTTDELTNKQVIFQFKAHGIGGVPDGMAIDENGNLWVATFGGGKVVNIDPRKPNALIRTIDMPIEDITSVTFGGCNLDEMYVTSPSVKPREGFKQVDGGYLYRITGLGVRGFPGRKVKL